MRQLLFVFMEVGLDRMGAGMRGGKMVWTVVNSVLRKFDSGAEHEEIGPPSVGHEEVVP